MEFGIGEVYCLIRRVHIGSEVVLEISESAFLDMTVGEEIPAEMTVIGGNIIDA